VKYFVDQAKSELSKQGFVPSEHTKVASALDDLVNKPPEDLTPAGMNAFMKRLGTIGGDEQGLAGILKGKVRGYLDNVQPTDMASGSSEDAGLVRTASSLWAQKSRDEALSEAFRQVDMAGGNTQTAVKTQFRKLANDDMFMNGLPDNAKAAIENAASTGKIESELKKVGALNPARGGILGMGSGAAIGGAIYGHPIAAIPAGIGIAADLGYRGITASKAAKAAGLVRQLGGATPTYPERFGGLIRNLLQ
jgi:hypothetical protein